MKNEIYLLLGSNLGNREDHLRWAREKTQERIGEIVHSSSLYTTEPWMMEASPWFLNQVIVVESEKTPMELLQITTGIELERGRKRQTESAKSYTSRELDIDLLYIGGEIVREKDLQVPHPRLHERRFTLLPLTEVAPNFIHPIFEQTQTELLQACPDHSRVERHS